MDEEIIKDGKKEIKHRPALKHVKENVGTALNKALEAIEDTNVDALEDVLKGINFNRKIGQRTLDDDTLADFIQNFEKIPLKDEDFEFPDLLGAAYEWLIKYFADSAGKKAGEFYTLTEVVRICVEICDPKAGMSPKQCSLKIWGIVPTNRRTWLKKVGLRAISCPRSHFFWYCNLKIFIKATALYNHTFSRPKMNIRHVQRCIPWVLMPFCEPEKKPFSLDHGA